MALMQSPTAVIGHGFNCECSLFPMDQYPTTSLSQSDLGGRLTFTVLHVRHKSFSFFTRRRIVTIIIVVLRSILFTYASVALAQSQNLIESDFEPFSLNFMLITDWNVTTRWWKYKRRDVPIFTSDILVTKMIGFYKVQNDNDVISKK
jgi:hypothetical protein